MNASKNITLMVISSSVLNFIGTVPFLIYYITGLFLHSSNQLEIFGDISKGLLMIANGSIIFIYYNCNKLFRQNLKILFRLK